MKRRIIRGVSVWRSLESNAHLTSNLANSCKDEFFCFKTQNLKRYLPSVYRTCSDCRCIAESWLYWALQHKCMDHFLSKARVDTKYCVRYKFVGLHVTKGMMQHIALKIVEVAMQWNTRPYPACGKQMTALDGLKDIWHNLWQCGEVRLGQRLFHLLNLHQTQRPLIPYNTSS